MWNKAQPHEAMPMLNTAVVKRSGRESRHTLALQGIPLLGNRDASFPRTLYFHRVWMNFGISPCTSVNIYFKGQSQVIHILTYSKISHTPTIFKWAVSCVKYIHIIVQWISRTFSSYKTETLYLLNTNNSLTLHFFFKGRDFFQETEASFPYHFIYPTQSHYVNILLGVELLTSHLGTATSLPSVGPAGPTPRSYSDCPAFLQLLPSVLIVQPPSVSTLKSHQLSPQHPITAGQLTVPPRSPWHWG